MGAMSEASGLREIMMDSMPQPPMCHTKAPQPHCPYHKTRTHLLSGQQNCASATSKKQCESVVWQSFVNDASSLLELLARSMPQLPRFKCILSAWNACVPLGSTCVQTHVLFVHNLRCKLPPDPCDPRACLLLENRKKRKKTSERSATSDAKKMAKPVLPDTEVALICSAWGNNRTSLLQTILCSRMHA
eukprot:1158243-Pelagomonas_calceolata.AAC.2